MIHKSLLFSGKPIKFDDSLGLGEIKQITVEDLFDNEMDISSFLEPFYMEVAIHDDIEISMMNTLFILSKKSLDESKEPILLKFQKSLSMIYDIDLKYIKLSTLNENVVIKILDKESKRFDEKSGEYKYKSKIIIDDGNIHILCKTVLEMTDTKVKKSDDDKIIGDAEVVAKFRMYRAREAQRQAEENKYIFYDMCNQIIHMQEVVDYSRILNLTIWQFKNTYNVLTNREVNDNIIKSGSVKYDAKNLNDWRKETKLK